MAPEAGLGLPGEAPSQYRGAAHGRAVPPTGPHRRPEAVWPVGEGGQGAAGGGPARGCPLASQLVSLPTCLPWRQGGTGNSVHQVKGEEGPRPLPTPSVPRAVGPGPCLCCPLPRAPTGGCQLPAVHSRASLSGHWGGGQKGWSAQEWAQLATPKSKGWPGSPSSPNVAGPRGKHRSG